MTPDHATHRIVLQDDCWPCTNFRERAEAAISDHPRSLIAFFVPGSPGGGRNRVLRASKMHEPYAPIGLGGWIPAVAVAWPVERALQFVSYVEGSPRRHTRADDRAISVYARGHRVEVVATVPSLVQHPDVEPSLIGRRASGGRNPARVAALFCDD
jgi:hypothetical protein